MLLSRKNAVSLCVVTGSESAEVRTHWKVPYLFALLINPGALLESAAEIKESPKMALDDFLHSELRFVEEKQICLFLPVAEITHPLDFYF